MDQLENVNYHGYVFEQGKEYLAFVPKESNMLGLTQGEKVVFRKVLNKPQIGERVKCNAETRYLSWLEIEKLFPVGKFSIDDIYLLQGNCILVALDAEESEVLSAQLVKNARNTYLLFQRFRESDEREERKWGKGKMTNESTRASATAATNPASATMPTESETTRLLPPSLAEGGKKVTHCVIL